MTIRIIKENASFAGEAARFIARTLRGRLATRERATLVLSGGETPRMVYRELGTLPAETGPDWSRIHLFWGDERSVPPDHQESNYHMVKHSLLSHIVIPEENIHRISGELQPEEAARSYEEEIRAFFRLSDNQLPEFDLLLLGLGTDGHTASLFPGSVALREASALVTWSSVENVKHRRITLTYLCINNAHAVLFLVSGRSKAAVLEEVLEGAGDRYPAGRVNPANGNLTWHVDKDAASLLARKEAK